MTPPEIHDYEFYETAECFTRHLMDRLRCRVGGVHNRVCYEPCVGNGAIVRAATSVPEHGVPSLWRTNDFDGRWAADTHLDATTEAAWRDDIDFTISNTPFSRAIAIAAHALRYSREGVALYLRASIHEPLKTGDRRTWFAKHPPTGTIWLPRFAHQRSRKTGAWTTDSMTSCWVLWLKHYSGQFIEYAPSSVMTEMDAEQPAYREQMDALNGLTGPESVRRAQWRDRWAAVVEEEGAPS